MGIQNSGISSGHEMEFMAVARGHPDLQKKYAHVVDICSPSMVQIDPKTHNLYLDNDVPYVRSWGILDTETDVFSLGYPFVPVISGILSYFSINDMVVNPQEFIAEYNTNHPRPGGGNDEIYQGIIGQLLDELTDREIGRETRLGEGLIHNYGDNISYGNAYNTNYENAPNGGNDFGFSVNYRNPNNE